MPNVTETLIAILATTSLGAILSSCPLDFGINGKAIHCFDRLKQIADQPPDLEQMIITPVISNARCTGELNSWPSLEP